MKRFDIITESDARALERGETVRLAKNGHITPLAADTLRERRVAVEHEGRNSPDEASLAPSAEIRSVASGLSWRPARRSRGTRASTTARTC